MPPEENIETQILKSQIQNPNTKYQNPESQVLYSNPIVTKKRRWGTCRSRCAWVRWVTRMARRGLSLPRHDAEIVSQVLGSIMEWERGPALLVPQEPAKNPNIFSCNPLRETWTPSTSPWINFCYTIHTNQAMVRPNPTPAARRSSFEFLPTRTVGNRRRFRRNPCINRTPAETRL